MVGFLKKKIILILMDDRSLPPIDCDKCSRGFHPSGVFKTKKGKNICIWCIRNKIIKLRSKNYGALYK